MRYITFDHWWSWGPKGRVRRASGPQAIASGPEAAGPIYHSVTDALARITSSSRGYSPNWVGACLQLESSEPVQQFIWPPAAASSLACDRWIMISVLCHCARSGAGIATDSTTSNQTGMQTPCRRGASALHGLLWCGLDRRKMQATSVSSFPALQVTEIARSYVSYMITSYLS